MPAQDLDNEPWFLTALPLPPLVPNQEAAEERQETGKSDENLPPIVPFKVPPAPRLVRSYLPSSLLTGELCGRRVLTLWERTAILDRLKHAEELDPERFQKHLSEAMQRNTKDYIQHVRSRAHRQFEEKQVKLRAAFLREQRRRDMIFYKHKHLLELWNIEKLMCQGKSWQCIIVCHMFLTSLIQKRRTREAMDTLSRLFGPVVKRHIHLKRKRVEMQNILVSHIDCIPFPTPQLIERMSGTFFDGWPPHLLERLVANARPMYLKKGSYLLHEGDVGRSMFMVTIGIVSIILPKRGKSKRRCKENSSGIFQIKAPCYVGEFALVCKEPRSASIYCETDIGFWVVLAEDYEAVSKDLSPEVASKQKQATNLRRQQNLKRFFPLKVDFLRQLPFFERFSEASLRKITESVEPIVLHDRDYLYRCGDLDSAMYFIGDGVATLRERTGEETRLTAGSCIAIFECVCDINARKTNAVVSINYCDVWRLSRERLIDAGMTEPSALLHCRQAARAERTSRIEKPGKLPLAIKCDPYLTFCLTHAVLNRFYDLCMPCIYLNGERIVIAGRPANALIVLVRGAIDITVRSNVQQETFRVSIPPLTTPTTSHPNAAPATATAATSSAPTAKPAAETWGMDTQELRALTRVLGAYEFAASISQYMYTVKSFGLTEAYYVDKATLEPHLPDVLKSLLFNSLKSRDIVLQAFKTKNLLLLSSNDAVSFVRLYKIAKEADKKMHSG